LFSTSQTDGSKPEVLSIEAAELISDILRDTDFVSYQDKAQVAHLAPLCFFARRLIAVLFLA
jgi:hypothetical protein